MTNDEKEGGMDLIHTWYSDRRLRRRLMDALRESDPYGVVLDWGDFQQLAALSFCNLVVAGCVEAQEHSAEGPAFSYLLRGNVDLQMLSPVDRIVAQRMKTARHAYQVIPEAAEALREASGALSGLRPLFPFTDGKPAGRQQVAEQFDRIMTRALQINTVGCGV